jgi:predicted acylesterase/phospholipase RssA
MAKYITLSPGGTGFYSLIGALSAMQDNGKLSNMEELSGSSAGAIAAFLYIVCKGDSGILKDEAMEPDLSEITKLNLRNFFVDYGFIDTDKIKSMALDITRRLTSLDNPTFQELYEYNPIKLHVSAYCLDINSTCYFSVDTHPHQPILDVICASIAVPIVFSPVSIQGKQYIDGGLEEIMPALPFLHRSGSEVYGIRIRFVHDNFVMNSIKNYIQKIMIPLAENRIVYNIPMLTIEMNSSDALDFSMPDKKKYELFVKGYQSVL